MCLWLRIRVCVCLCVENVWWTVQRGRHSLWTLWLNGLIILGFSDLQRCCYGWCELCTYVLLLWGVKVSDIKNHTKKARAALIDDKLCGLRMEASKIKINNLSVQSYPKKKDPNSKASADLWAVRHLCVAAVFQLPTQTRHALGLSLPTFNLSKDGLAGRSRS